MYKFRMPIGDWSADGHGVCEYYFVRSNLPVDIVRDAHFQIKETTGIDIEGICKGYAENYIDDEILIEELASMGFRFVHSDKEDDCIYVSPLDMARLWCFLLEKAWPGLELELTYNDEIPMLPFYGYDENNRNIGFVGYGVFD